MTKTQRWVLINILFMAPLCQGASDIYTPALPEISHYFNLSHTWSQLTIIVFLFSYAFGQLIWGFYSDYYGRKPALLYGMGLSLFGFILAVISHHMAVLLAARVIQGVGLGAIGINYKAIVIDSFDKKEVYSVSSMVNSAWGLGPVIAPLIGGYLTDWKGWQANFWFLFFYTAVSMLFIVFTLKESLVERIHLSRRELWLTYKKMLLSVPLWSGTVVMAVVFIQMLAFNLLAPFLIIKLLHYSVITYGHVALSMGVAFLLGTFINKRCLHYVEPHIICYAAIMLSILAAAVMLILHFVTGLNFYAILVPALIINLTVGLIFPNTVIRTQFLFKDNAGLTTSVIGVLMLLLTAIATLLISLAPTTSMLALALWDLAMAVIGLVGYSLLHTQDKSV